MIAWLEPEDTEGNYQDALREERLQREAEVERRKLRKILREAERDRSIQKGRARNYMDRLKDTQEELETVRRELNLHREIHRLRAENERLRRSRTKPSNESA